jgi:hypothetical protein
VIGANDLTKPARKALRRIESTAPEAAELIGAELARARRRIAAGDLRRAAAAASTAVAMAIWLEHDAALPGWRAVQRLAGELRELVMLLRLEARAAGVSP